MLAADVTNEGERQLSRKTTTGGAQDTGVSKTVVPFELTPNRNKFGIVNGRGDAGKSTLIRILKERADLSALKIRLLDTDWVNRRTSTRYPDAIAPPKADSSAIKREFDDWWWRIVSEEAPKRLPILMDSAGNDARLMQLFRKYRVKELLTQYNYIPTMVYMCGGSEDDMAMLRMMEEEERFITQRTILIFGDNTVENEADTDEEFEKFENSDLVKAIKDRGGRVISFPKMAVLHLLDTSPMTYAQAAALNPPEGMVNPLRLDQRQQLGDWLDNVKEELADVDEWLI